MCGIAGLLSPVQQRDVKEKVWRMVAALGHRGPDGSHVWHSACENVALGHTRLAIIDLTKEGKQPMLSHNGNFVMTYNGEIYNYVELRSELESMGTHFKGRSDTEVLLAAIVAWGLEEALGRARGMFALAVWERKKRCLWLARDRVGKKPLYYYDGSNMFVFASEMKGILAFPGLQVSISQQSISDFLTLGYIVGSNTVYKEICEVKPGSILKIDNDLKQIHEKKYWRFPSSASSVLTSHDAVKMAEQKLEEAVRLRLRSDTPVGVLLSGGIDSGLITAYASKWADQPLQTFTIGFSDSVVDESRLARLVANRYGTVHHEIQLEANLGDNLIRVVRAYDEPFGDPSAFPTFVVAREASKHVKVVLNGEGSDELFGGYRRIFAMRLMEQFRFLLERIPQKAYHLILKALPHPKGFRTWYSFFYRFIRGLCVTFEDRYIQWSSDGFEESEKKGLLKNSNTCSAHATSEILQQCCIGYRSLPSLAAFMALDFLVGMTDCLLPKIDIATMAHGLEARSPFLDQELVGQVAALDKRCLLRGWSTKPLLRTIAKAYLPSEIVTAPKRGFEIPLVRWMAKDLYSMVLDICTSNNSILFDLFHRKKVLSILHRRCPVDAERWAKQVWILFMLASWGEYVYRR